MREDGRQWRAWELVATAATEAKEPCGSYGQNLLSVALWQLKVLMCAPSHVGILCGPQERGACLVQTLVPGTEEDQDTVEFAKS